MINQLETKSQTLNIAIQRFHLKFNILNQKGLPGLVFLNDKLIKLEYYCKKLYTIAVDRAKFGGIKGQIIGKAFMKALEFNLTITHEIRHLFLNKPTFERRTKVDEIFRKMVNLEIPSEERWDQLCDTIE